MLVVSESGLYALIFTSRKDEARRFRKWVTGEVLPALRREGRYTLPGRTAVLPTRPATLRLKQTVKATLLSCAVQIVKMRDGHSEEILPEFERFCAAVAGPDNPAANPTTDALTCSSWNAAASSARSAARARTRFTTLTACCARAKAKTRSAASCSSAI